MNARVELVANRYKLDVDVIRPAVQQLLRSPLFVRAPRTSSLLDFLVDQTLDGMGNTITEHAIGLAVFRRDARSYDTALDPVVRVQMGRLRARLAQYDAVQPAASMHLTIPLGTYVPEFAFDRVKVAPSRPIQLTPLRDLTGAAGSERFVAGVEEELGSKLFQAFGSLVQLPPQSLAWPASGAGPQHRLEGSVRVENNHVRASMRLVDTRAGDIAWLSQFDCTGELGMTLQEELAGAICMQVKRYLSSVLA
jgi:TolB-like protein